MIANPTPFDLSSSNCNDLATSNGNYPAYAESAASSSETLHSMPPSPQASNHPKPYTLHPTA